MSDLSFTPSFKIPHLVRFKTPGLPPSWLTAQGLAAEQLVQKSAFRNWFVRGMLDTRIDHNHIWIQRHLFLAWIEDQRRTNQRLPDEWPHRKGYCVHCKKIVTIPSSIVRLIKGKLDDGKVQSPTFEFTINRGGKDAERQNYFKAKQFINYMEEVQHVSNGMLDRYSFYLGHLLQWANDQNFGEAPAILPALQANPAYLTDKDGQSITAPESPEKIVEISKRFFYWAKATYPKEFAKVTLSWIEALRSPYMSPMGDVAGYVSEEEINRLMAVDAPKSDLTLFRDKAAAARLYLTGERISAFTTSPILAFDIANGSVRQWPELGVHTKFGQRATTFLLPIPHLMEIVLEYDDLVRTNLPPNYPWYARIEERRGERKFSSELPGENRRVPFEKRLHILYSLAGLPFKTPIKFRQGHAMFGLSHAKTTADYKAILFNLMHDSLAIKDDIYARITENDQKTRIQGLANNPILCPDNELRALIYNLSPHPLPQALQYIAARLSQ